MIMVKRRFASRDGTLRRAFPTRRLGSMARGQAAKAPRAAARLLRNLCQDGRGESWQVTPSPADLLAMTQADSLMRPDLRVWYQPSMKHDRASKQQIHARRFDRVLDYIDRHLDENLTVEGLGNVANLSKFHFHRRFNEYCGVNIGQYIQLMKLKRASNRLAFNPQDRIIDIALDAGFESLSPSLARSRTHSARRPAGSGRIPPGDRGARAINSPFPRERGPAKWT